MSLMSLMSRQAKWVLRDCTERYASHVKRRQVNVVPNRGLPQRARWVDGGDESTERCWPLVMGIVNITPDSFYDGGRHASRDAAIAHARQLVGEGADIVDIGGESTRPGAQAISESEELDRVIPVIQALRAESDTLISIDTSRSEVMRQCVAAGAGLLNDVRAFEGDPEAFSTACGLGLPVCLMHMLGEPRSMQADPQYDDVVAEVRHFLHERAAPFVAAGMDCAQILVDPGIGFGKRLSHNLSLLRALPELIGDGYPVLLGASRKSMLGEITGRSADERLSASLAVAIHGARSGVAVLRVHDVAATIDCLKVCHAIDVAA
jgi:dihydropteroate synthase